MKERHGPPSTTRRLFPHDEDVPAREASETYLIGRLLEEGETADLKFLTSRVHEERLRQWVRDRATRQLSRRSRAFWELALGVESGKDPGDDLWPL